MSEGLDIDGLVERAKDGDSDAFGEIFDLFLPSVFRFIFFRTSSKEDAEDIAEDVFIKAWRNIEKFKKRKNVPFSAWLFQIAKNSVYDFWRKNKETYELSDEEVDKNAHENVSKGAENNFERKKMMSALKKIPNMQADAISLKFFSDLSNAEIASVLDKTEGAVRILLSRGLKKLRTIMQD